MACIERRCNCLHWPHRKAVSAFVVVHVTARTVQVQITCVRVRPAITVAANIVDRRARTVVAITRSGEHSGLLITTDRNVFVTARQFLSWKLQHDRLYPI